MTESSTPFSTTLNPSSVTPWFKYPSGEVTGFFGFMILVFTVGTVCNVYLVGHFIRKIRSATGRRNCVNTKSYSEFYIALSLFDMLVCFSCTLIFISYASSTFYSEHRAFSSASFTIFFVSVDISGFLYLLMFVIRSVRVVFPVRVINWRAVKVVTVCFSVFVLIFDIIGISGIFDLVFCIKLLILFCLFRMSIVLTVVLSLVHDIKKSFQRELYFDKIKIILKSTVLMIIYCAVNIGFLYLLCKGVIDKLYSQDNHSSIPDKLILSIGFIIIPGMSIRNPVAYFARRRAMKARRAQIIAARAERRQNRTGL